MEDVLYTSYVKERKEMNGGHIVHQLCEGEERDDDVLQCFFTLVKVFPNSVLKIQAFFGVIVAKTII